MRAGLRPEHFVRETKDYFHDMDYNTVYGKRPAFTQAEVEGRNMWMVWTGGNDRLWDRLTVDSIGSFDLLKTISSHPRLGYGRHNRWYYLGLVNEPCFSEAAGPDPNRFGLWLDVRDPKCPPDPFANAKDYPGVAIGARGKTVDVGSYYGEPTGVVGLRLFTNPDFDENARRRWNSDRFYNDPDYYSDRDLVRPYRVGMACAFCHVGPSPIKPPADPENPKWEDLNAVVGAQYFWWDRVFNWAGVKNENSIFYQALHVSRPGTLDTSLVSTDNINNPRTMNAVYYLGPRMAQAKKWGKETIAGGALNNKQFNDYVPPTDPLSQFFVTPDTTWTPRVLKDGADSVGALGALNRVYINIGVFSEEWLLHFRALLGGEPISPIPLETAEKNSVYWRATEMQSPNMARYLLAGTDPHYLKDAPGGSAYLTDTADTVERGKAVFADTLRAMPLEQAAAAAGRPRSRERQRAALSRRVERLLGLDEDRRIQNADAGTGCREGFSRRQLSLHRAARTDHRARHQCLQSPGDQCHPGKHLGQLRIRVLQDAAVRRHDQDSSPDDREGDGLSAAGGRPRLHPARVARQRVVDCAISPEQHGRTIRVESLGRSAHALVREVDRADAVARTTGERCVVWRGGGARCRRD